MDISALQQLIQLQALSQMTSSTSTANDSTSADSSSLFSNVLSETLSNQTTSNNSTLNQTLGLVSGLTNNANTTNALSLLSALSANATSTTNLSDSLAALGSASSTSATSSLSGLYDQYRNVYNTNAAATNTVSPTNTGEKTNYDSIIKTAAETFNIPEKMIKAVIKQESGFNANATSSAGAGGLMQLMPATASSLGVSDVYDAEQNIMAGTKYLKQMLDKFGSYETMLAAYNAGPGNVSKYAGIPPFNETQNYVSKIMKTYNS